MKDNIGKTDVATVSKIRLHAGSYCKYFFFTLLCKLYKNFNIEKFMKKNNFFTVEIFSCCAIINLFLLVSLIDII